MARLFANIPTGRIMFAEIVLNNTPFFCKRRDNRYRGNKIPKEVERNKEERRYELLKEEIEERDREDILFNDNLLDLD